MVLGVFALCARFPDAIAGLSAPTKERPPFIPYISFLGYIVPQSTSPTHLFYIYKTSHVPVAPSLNLSYHITESNKGPRLTYLSSLSLRHFIALCPFSVYIFNHTTSYFAHFSFILAPTFRDHSKISLFLRICISPLTLQQCPNFTFLWLDYHSF